MSDNVIDITELVTTPEERETYNEYLDRGFSKELSAVAMGLCLEIDKLRDRIIQIEQLLAL